MVLAMTICLAALCCVLSVFLSWRYIQKTYAAIDTIFDSILAQKAGLSFETELDSRLSKLTHKAIKIVQMNSAGVVQLGQEKQTIQSLLSDMSHQMKTPLSSISMYIDLLLEGNLSSGEQREFFTRIKAGSEKLGWLMDSLIKMSRLEVGAIELAPVPAGIKQTISDSISMVLAAAAKKNISIQAEPFMDTPLLHDRKWTVEAMANILENAVKYSEANSKICISVEALPLYTKINFTDHGVGIAPEEWNSIFKRFYRGKNVKMTDGAGLGLYLASLILEKQGGYILVDSEPNKDTTFSMLLQNCKK